jgi:hypothetical protein
MAPDVANGNAVMAASTDSCFMTMRGSVQDRPSGATRALKGRASLWGGIAGRGAYDATGSLNAGAHNWIGAAAHGAGGILDQPSGASGTTGGIGEAISDGLTQGIKTAGQRAITAAAQLANDILGKLLGVVRIFSPSRVMRDSISLGVAVGIEEHDGLHALAAAGGMADGVLSATTVGRSIGRLNRSYLAARPLGTTAAALAANDGTQVDTYVTVMIGDQELRGIVKTEIINDRRDIRRAVTAGARAAR